MGGQTTVFPVNQVPEKHVLPFPAAPFLNIYSLKRDGSDRPENIAHHEHYKEDLEVRTMQSILNRDGTLTKSAIDEAKVIINGDDLGSSRLRKELASRGQLSDWGKYRTEEFYTPYPTENIKDSKRNIGGRVHFYKNKKTGEVYYDMDYKVKLKLSKSPQIPVSDFIESLETKWRTKYDY